MPGAKFQNGKRPTIYDLARQTGVSPGTVSRVLNNRDRVKAETRARVLQAAKQLDLKPQAAVRVKQIAVVSTPTFPDRVEGYAARLTSHVSFSLARRNFSVLHPTDPHVQLPGTFLDGIIAVTFDREMLAVLEKVESRIPVVYMDRFDCKPHQHAVCSDHYMSGYLAGQHFIARGKQNLAIIGADVLPMQERLRGYRKAMEEAGIETQGHLTQPRGIDVSNTCYVSTAYVSTVTRVARSGTDAIFAPGASFEGINCLHILTYIMGLRVPEDIALIAGEVPGVCEVLNPPLSTIEEPLAQMAEKAVEWIDRLASGEKKPPQRLHLPVRLIDRASVS